MKLKKVTIELNDEVAKKFHELSDIKQNQIAEVVSKIIEITSEDRPDEHSIFIEKYGLEAEEKGLTPEMMDEI